MSKSGGLAAGQKGGDGPFLSSFKEDGRIIRNGLAVAGVSRRFCRFRIWQVRGAAKHDGCRSARVHCRLGRSAWLKGAIESTLGLGKPIQVPGRERLTNSRQF